MKNQNNIDEEGQDIQVVQETKQKPFYRYTKLIILCCCWLLFTVRKNCYMNNIAFVLDSILLYCS